MRINHSLLLFTAINILSCNIAGNIESYGFPKDIASHMEEQRITLLAVIIGGTVILLFVGILVALLISILEKRTIEKMSLESEREKYMNLYESAVSERDALDRMLDEKTIPEKLRYTISKRLGILDSIIISNISDRASDVKRADEELNRLLADRESFIKDTRMILEEKSRYFFSQLQEKGLTDKEIDVCCMYAIGMKGKDIKNYAHIHNLYKDSSEMRRKLGLQENDTNLSLYIQKLLESGSR